MEIAVFLGDPFEINEGHDHTVSVKLEYALEQLIEKITVAGNDVKLGLNYSELFLKASRDPEMLHLLKMQTFVEIDNFFKKLLLFLSERKKMESFILSSFNFNISNEATSFLLTFFEKNIPQKLTLILNSNKKYFDNRSVAPDEYPSYSLSMLKFLKFLFLKLND